MKVYLEHLYHFNCDRCQGWWSIGDFKYRPGFSIFCPHCNAEHTLPKGVKGNRLRHARSLEVVELTDEEIIQEIELLSGKTLDAIFREDENAEL